MRKIIMLAACLSSGALAQSGRTAVWLRPPNTAAELERTLVQARQAGFTDVLLEGFYHGRAVWSSNVAPMKLPYDALKVAARVADREGLRLNVWMETMYWRPAAKFGVPVTPLWRDDAATRTRDGRASLDVSNLGFVDPADEGVRRTLDALVREVATAYPKVGLHLDYLRYPREDDFGFHPAAVDGFRAQSGLDARRIAKYGEGGRVTPEWQAWSRYRRDLITSLAEQLIGAYRSAGGQGQVSAAVFSGLDPLQDWRSWPGLDAAMPMLYLPSAGLYRLALLPYERGARVWPGIQVGPGRPALAEQLRVVRSLGFPNVAVFGWTPPDA
ncbi:hypothetical protein [Deinococcus maricopensis]|nr:hypothetical protein [Deinococcus maricopensis]